MRFLLALWNAREGGRAEMSCLIGNTVAELVPGDEPAQALTATAYDDIVEVLTAALTADKRPVRSPSTRCPSHRHSCYSCSSTARRWCPVANPTVSALQRVSMPRSTPFARQRASIATRVVPCHSCLSRHHHTKRCNPASKTSRRLHPRRLSGQVGWAPTARPWANVNRPAPSTTVGRLDQP
jgi:hypothetical protein